jgi:hypothetical protein
MEIAHKQLISTGLLKIILIQNFLVAFISAHSLKPNPNIPDQSSRKNSISISNMLGTHE